MRPSSKDDANMLENYETVWDVFEFRGSQPCLVDKAAKIETS